MKKLAFYLADYFRQLDYRNFIFISLALSVLIWVNYYFKLNTALLSAHSFTGRFQRIYFLYFLTFSVAWIYGFAITGKKLPGSFFFWVLLILSPAVFAVKVSLQAGDLLPGIGNYWKIVLNWPLKALSTFILAFILWFGTNNSKPFAGLNAKNFNPWPYVILLILMFPLLLGAAQSHDFQQVYPKLHHMLGARVSVLQAVLFELSYGIDFFTIELFFRGFLIIAFIKYGGRAAILPMAAFYCTIHFGKPLFECISSYFGGIILGAIVYNTRSVWGGLIVHLGIAWMMELIAIF